MKITQIPQLLGTVLRKLTLEDCPLGYCPHLTLILIQTLILTPGRTCWERGNLLGGNFLVTVGYVIFMTYMREMVNQKINVLMKTKEDIHLNRCKKDYKVSVKAFEKVMFHFELRNIVKVSCLL